MAVDILDLQRTINIDKDRLGRHALWGLRTMGRSSWDLTIVLVNDRRMRALNAAYRNKRRTTDVLSFEAGPPLPGMPSPKNPFLGEIVISLPRAFAQADTVDIPLDDEITNLMIHGLCHLLGYDHERGEQEAREMKKAEDRMARAIRKKEPALEFPANISGKIPETDIRERIPG
ncbi:MAG: rRNA maturation RNase YbeY [Nitrospirae bacterium]|nr:rRNA maturation RNase YbeY [Nitrospirota bacterium]MCL5285557.1 rRNA maturation RNase YbeY [Nitrospirota bacterium]